MKYILIPLGTLVVACTHARLYYLQTELPYLEQDITLLVGPGPWPRVPNVHANQDSVPDELVLSTLTSLMALPGAADACDGYGRPYASASEYCVALYRTARDWRVTWPIRLPQGSQSACVPPFGGVDDADFGRGLPVFGYAHNHPCGLFASSPDMGIFPTAKTPEGKWVFVAYASTPSGEPVRDASGERMTAWAWLATGHSEAPRFYKWNAAGEVFRWNEDNKRWQFQASCKPQRPSMMRKEVLPPKCSPEWVDWY